MKRTKKRHSSAAARRPVSGLWTRFGDATEARRFTRVGPLTPSSVFFLNHLPNTRQVYSNGAREPLPSIARETVDPAGAAQRRGVVAPAVGMRRLPRVERRRRSH